MSKHRSLEQWQDIINLHQSSGLSVSDFCRDNNISTTAFYATKKKLTEETLSSSAIFTRVPSGAGYEVILEFAASGAR
ncbi:IS66 family insertion sequence element accessory protein TnpA [Psychrobium sp. nBUS_13]|uniref:IS66 family insertion sequence element accessory protein TnpA n=1 Tax=Psychrobium sp. nBUS_13 TaxID=3395319 RepID=UPI003EB98A4D